MDIQLTIPTQRIKVDPLAVIEGTDLADSTKDKYKAIIVEYGFFCLDLPFDKESKKRYRVDVINHLATSDDLLNATKMREFANTKTRSRRALLRAAIGIYIDCLRDMMDANADPLAENAQELEARISLAERRYRSVKKAIQVKLPSGNNVGTWLSRTQVRQLFLATNGGIEGERDRVALGLLMIAGLRCGEAVNRTFDDIKLLPVGDKTRTVLQVQGKGNKLRTVPISDHLVNLIDVWGQRIAHQGRIIRSLGRNREPGDKMSGVGLSKLVQRVGKRINEQHLSPNDLRKTYAQEAFSAGIPITQISTLLGHASVSTTQKYLDLHVDLETTASDILSSIIENEEERITIPTQLLRELVDVCTWHETLSNLYHKGETYELCPDQDSVDYLDGQRASIKCWALGFLNEQIEAQDDCPHILEKQGHNSG